jgi:MFS family permease
MRMGLLEVFMRHRLDKEVETAKMFFALSVACLLFGPFAMLHLDKWQRRPVMMVSDAVRMVLVGVMVWWLWSRPSDGDTPWTMGWVYFLIFLIGVIATFYLPTRYALLPNLVEGESLIKANTLFTTSLAVAAVGGMPLGALVAVHAGPLWALGVNAVAYALSVALIFRIKVPPHATRPVPDERAGGSARELREGFVYLWRHPTVAPLVLIAGVFAFLGGILIVTIVGYAEKTLEMGTLGLGWLGGAAGLGAGLGVVLLGRGRRWTRSIWLPPAQLVAGGVVLGLLSATSNPLVALPLLTALGAVGATAIIPIDAKLQEEAGDERRGAVFAARGMLTSATMIVAFWLKFGTNVLRTTPPPTVLMWCGGGAMVVAGLTFWALRMRRPGGSGAA